MEEGMYAALSVLGVSVVWGSFDEAEGFPRITLQQVSDNKSYTLKSRGQIQNARVQVDVFAETYLEVRDTANRVQDILETLRDSAGVIRCYEISRRSNKSETGGDAIQLMQLDFKVRYRA